MVFKNSVIHKIADANVTAYTYNTIVVGSSSASFTINNVSVSLAPGTVLDIKVNNISGSGDVYLLGTQINVYTGSNTLPN